MLRQTVEKTRKSRKARSMPLQEAYDAFLERLIAARREANLTQREVSALMGRPHTFLSKCESGERSVDVVELLQLAAIYQKPVSYFLR
ncbi:MAG: helix-turn-helix domain-containing protein [Terriglobia bacterium]